MLTNQEWSQWITAARSNDRCAANAAHSKARQWVEELFEHPFLNDSDLGASIYNCARYAYKYDIKNTTTRRKCSLTGSMDYDSHTSVQMTLLDGEPTSIKEEEMQLTEWFTIHKNMIRFLKCVSTVSLVWAHVLQASKDSQGCYAGYLNAIEYIELMLEKVDH